MLKDQERKLLRILFNLGRKYGRGPTYDELRTLTGRSSRRDLEEDLRTLQMERYISWDGRDPSTVKVLEGWERR